MLSPSEHCRISPWFDENVSKDVESANAVISLPQESIILLRFSEDKV
jgi:hypothetical protein